MNSEVLHLLQMFSGSGSFSWWLYFRVQDAVAFFFFLLFVFVTVLFLS